VIRGCTRAGQRPPGPADAAGLPLVGESLSPLARCVIEVLGQGDALRACELRLRVSDRRGVATPLVSIYRVLAQLRSRGLVVQAATSKRYAIRHPAVAHPALLLICHQCGAIGQKEGETLAHSARVLAGELGFDAKDLHLELVGICRGCAEGRPRRSEDPVSPGGC
jgi:Fe2+ or Zn2+ uptake regulation protein